MVGEVEGMSLWWGRWRGCRYGGGGNLQDEEEEEDDDVVNEVCR